MEFVCIFLLMLPIWTSAQELSRCRRENGGLFMTVPFTKQETCREGIFYSCDNGLEVRHVCPNAGEAYNPETGSCGTDLEQLCSFAAVCPTNHVAGPHPNGYECEEDCLEMGMCWDVLTSKCLCKDNLNCPKEAPVESRCPHNVVTEVRCNPAASLEVYPDIASCVHFYLCIFGNRYHFDCPEGEVFSKDASSYCDSPRNVAPPCGSHYF